MVAVTIVTKAFVLQNLMWPAQNEHFIPEFRSSDLLGQLSSTRRFSLEEKDLEQETKKAWAYNRNSFVRYGQSMGGGGLPIAAVTLSSNGSDSDSLISQQFEKVS